MTRVWTLLVVVVGGLALVSMERREAAAQGGLGCLSTGTCKEDPSPVNTPDDFWHNWICTECHVGPPTGLAPSPVERALIATPPKFWAMHADATRDARTLRRAAADRTRKPAEKLNLQLRKLMDQRPKQ